jgi:hypothetical protein
MSHFIVEHKRNGNYVMETLSGVEDIDTSVYKDLLGIWVCDSNEELLVMENELRRMRHERSSQPS